MEILSSNQHINDTHSSTPKLKKVLGLWQLIIYGIAFMTPIAPAYIYGYVSNMTGGMMVQAYFFALIPMLFTAFSFGKMSASFPLAGSTYNYIHQVISPFAGFIAGWAMFMDYVLVPMVVMMLGAIYANTLFPFLSYEIAVLILASIIFVINFLGINFTAKANNILVVYMCVIVFLFLLLGLRLLLNQSSTENIDWIKPIHNPLNYDFMSIVSGAALASFSFLGFDAITTLSEEAIRPAKDVGRAAVLSCFVGGILFMLQAYVAQMVWPDYSIFKSTEAAFFEIVTFVGGNYFSVLFTIAIIVSALSAGLTGQSSAARIMYAMGRDKVLPAKFFSYIHPKFETPALNIIMMSFLGVAGALILSLDLVAELMNFGALLGFMFVNVSVILYFYFQKKDKKIISHFIVPALGFVSCTYLWINLSTRTLWIGFVWLALGCIYYFIKQKQSASRQAG